LLSIKSNISFLDLFSPFILYSLFWSVPLTISPTFIIWPGPVTSPIASKVASPKSISCSAPIWPLTSPTNPPVVSIPVVATVALRNLPAFTNWLPTPLDIPRVKASTAPIFLPLATALCFNFSSFSASSKTALMFSLVNLTPSPISSCNNCINVKPVSIDPTKPPIAPEKVPVIAPAAVVAAPSGPRVKPVEPIAAPPAAPTPALAAVAPRTSSDCKELAIITELLTKNWGTKPGLSYKALKVPKIPPPYFFWSFAKLTCSLVGPYWYILLAASAMFVNCSSFKSLPILYMSKASSIVPAVEVAWL